MAADDNREGQDIARRIREELERIRESEGRVQEALEAVRQARRRVEVIARELTREEARVRALVREELTAAGAPVVERPAVKAPDPDRIERWATRRDDPIRLARPAIDPSSGATPSPRDTLPLPVPALRSEPAPVVSSDDGDVPTLSPAAKAGWGTQDHRARILGIAALVMIAIAAIGWFAIRGFQQEDAPVVATDVTLEPVVAPPPAAPAPPPDVLASAPSDPASLVVLYDSLFGARSPVFDPLLTIVDQQTSERTIKRAVVAWRAGPLDAQEADLIHSAFVQRVLKLDTDPRIEIDGQVLRNPCRGRSCTALLTFWKAKGIQYGLPSVPADAATNVAGLRQAEVALVFGWLKEVHGTATAPAVTDSVTPTPTPTPEL